MDYKQAALRMIQAGEHDPEALRDAFEMVRCLELDGSMEETPKRKKFFDSIKDLFE